jgi:uracil phosphoribosyltransferase
LFNLEGNLWVVDHPFAQQELTKIRNKNTNQIQFRKGLVRLGRICGYELMKILEKQEIEVETPLEKCKGIKISDEDKIIIINVLRAAFPLVEGLLKAFPLAKQGVISAKRVERSLNNKLEFDVEVNYIKIPDLTENDIVLIADPMLASGSTLMKVIEHINKKGVIPKKIISLSVISSEYGIQKMTSAFPNITFVTVAIDPKMNEKGYILPGLGDAGDRSFG